MADIKINVSYRALKKGLEEFAYGIGKMTDGYLKEIAEAGKERLDQAYGEEYASESMGGYDDLIPVPNVRVVKTKQHSYALTVGGENVDLLEYGTGIWSADYDNSLGTMPAGWESHIPRSNPKGEKEYWYFEYPPGLEPNLAWNKIKYKKVIKEPGGTPEYKIDKWGERQAIGAWGEYEAKLATHEEGYEMVTSPTWGVSYGHAPANGLPKAWETMQEKAKEAAKHFYQNKYK